MPPQLQSQEDLQEEARTEAAHKAQLSRIEEELVLYDDEGPWQFFKARLKELEDNALAQLLFCPQEEILAWRDRVRVVRYLSSIKELLLAEKASLQEDVTDE